MRRVLPIWLDQNVNDNQANPSTSTTRQPLFDINEPFIPYQQPSNEAFASSYVRTNSSQEYTDVIVSDPQRFINEDRDLQEAASTSSSINHTHQNSTVSSNTQRSNIDSATCSISSRSSNEVNRNVSVSGVNETIAIKTEALVDSSSEEVILSTAAITPIRSAVSTTPTISIIAVKTEASEEVASSNTATTSIPVVLTTATAAATSTVTSSLPSTTTATTAPTTTTIKTEVKSENADSSTPARQSCSFGIKCYR